MQKRLIFWREPFIWLLTVGLMNLAYRYWRFAQTYAGYYYPDEDAVVNYHVLLQQHSVLLRGSYALVICAGGWVLMVILIAASSRRLTLYGAAILVMIFWFFGCGEAVFVRGWSGGTLLQHLDSANMGEQTFHLTRAYISGGEPLPEEYYLFIYRCHQGSTRCQARLVTELTDDHQRWRFQLDHASHQINLIANDEVHFTMDPNTLLPGLQREDTIQNPR